MSQFISVYVDQIDQCSLYRLKDYIYFSLLEWMDRNKHPSDDELERLLDELIERTERLERSLSSLTDQSDRISDGPATECSA